MQAVKVDCPKCFVPMHRIERNGVVIERCPECSGVFLDRGELEHMIRGESATMVPSGTRGTRDVEREYARDREGYAPAGRPPRREREVELFESDHGDDDFDDDRRGDGYDASGKPRKKRRGFLEDLFDF